MFRSVKLVAIRLQPEGREKFYWSGEQFVITCQNNNNIKNGEYQSSDFCCLFQVDCWWLAAGGFKLATKWIISGAVRPLWCMDNNKHKGL